MKSISLGKVAGLKITAHPTAFAGFILLWIGLGAAGLVILNLSPGEAILGGLLAAALHFVDEFVHNIGHSLAARSTGYPMIGVRFWWILGGSVYPKDEPELPARIHIRRALGGPAMSFVAALVFGLVALAVRGSDGLAWWLIVFGFLDNLFFFALGSFLPLGFTDGSTLLRYWGKS